MLYQNLEIPGVKLILLDRHNDHRGWLNESWRDSWNSCLETDIDFIQDMWSWNEHPYTLRGLHALREPAKQSKLVMVLKGTVFDVVVDARKDSPTYKKYLYVYLSGLKPTSLLIPPGCYHGYLTLQPDTLLGYKVDCYHSKEYDSGIRWNDPEINISWPLEGKTPIISDRDTTHPFLRDL